VVEAANRPKNAYSAGAAEKQIIINRSTACESMIEATSGKPASGVTRKTLLLSFKVGYGLFIHP
jgi:hypothetical protein